VPGADEDIADFEDNPDDVWLTVTAKLVVRVTRPEILRKHAADAQRAMAEAHSPGDFGEFAYLAVISEGLDEVAEGPAGQLRFLLNASDVIGGIRGIAIEESDLSVEVTPRDGGTHPAAAFRLLNNQPGKRRAARPYTGWRRVWPLARASGTQGRLGLVRRCAVSGAWWRQMA